MPGWAGFFVHTQRQLPGDDLPHDRHVRAMIGGEDLEGYLLMC